MRPCRPDSAPIRANPSVLQRAGHVDRGGVKVSAKFVPASGGVFSYTGKATATGGTGVFKDAHGTLTISGTSMTSDPDAATVNMTGTLKY